MKYPLCCQTVTVYRRAGEQVQRQVLEGVFYAWEALRQEGELGYGWDTRFSLILPGSQQRIAVGDRVFDGIGPEVTAQQWPGFIPVTVPGLAQVQFVKPVYLGGEITHWEAGRK